MTLDASVERLLASIAALGGPGLEAQSVDEARLMFKVLCALDGEPEPVESITEHRVAGPGGEFAVRLYRPAGDEPLPLLVWFHGGGWVIGDLDTADTTCRKLANRSGAAVASIDYRLGPEHRWPAAVDDSWAALLWAIERAPALGVDAGRIAVGGDSSGGNLAALVALRARSEGGPPLALQLLIYPVTDLTLSHPSMDANGDGYLLTKAGMQWFVNHYLGAHGDATDPGASPLYADEVAGVAPAHVMTAEYDPLRDEGEAYATRLADAGVPVTVRRYDGMVHFFLSLGGPIPAGDAAVTDAASVLRSAFSKAPGQNSGSSHQG